MRFAAAGRADVGVRRVLQQLISLFKFDFDTVRDLERKGSRVFKMALVAGVIGLVLTITMQPALMVLGIPLLVVGAAVFFFAMIWMLRLQREATRHLFCPYCASKNDVFVSRKEFSCDICGRRIGVSPAAEPVPLEPIEEEED